MPIRILPPDVSDKIAAGEVVERPASVVKELLENAIDAGATEIGVEAREGGRRLVRVQDNGSGIPAEEVELAFARHATSKLRSAEDLSRITTLGFRGEALSSIAAVSRLTMLTRTADDQSAVLLKVEGGRIVARDDRGMPPGTIVTVEHLFYNTPARSKFLRATPTESGHIHQIVTRYALAYPERRFSLIVDGRLMFRSTGGGRLYDVLVKVYGLDLAEKMLEVGGGGEAVKNGDSVSVTSASTWSARDGAPIISGYVGVPSLHRSNRQHITLYVNCRWIRDSSLSYAVTQAYHTLLPAGRFPVALVFIAVDPAAVDVNVHPTKAEVRFSDSHDVFQAVQREVRRVLVDQSPVPDWTSHRAAWAGGDWGRRRAENEGLSPTVTQAALELQRPIEQDSMEAAGNSTGRLPMLRVVGQLGSTYIVAEGPEGMYLIDQHAAHERVLYEKIMAEVASMVVASQGLLDPLTLDLSPLQAATLAENLQALGHLGFDIEPFGGETYLVRGVPALLTANGAHQGVLDIIDGLPRSEVALTQGREEALVRLICKQAAVKAGQSLSGPEMRELVEQLEATSSPRTCPHGRPTMVLLSAAQLAREFGRA
jgi:DNA mismatch repair protein MutL